MKIVQHPRGTTEQEDGVVGLEGQIRVDTVRKEIRLHDGLTQGGIRLPNYETVRQMIASSSDTETEGVTVVNTEGDLAAIIPSANKIALLNLVGSEDMFVWQPGAAPDGGAITSTVEGHWQRLDSRMGFWVRMYRAGVVSMQINGAEPGANQDTTVWIDNGTVKLWNGAAYAAATPTLTARLFAEIGGYAVGSVTLPDRLADLAFEDTDLDTITESGWYKSSAGAANAPVAGVHIVEHRQIDADDAIQFFYLHNNSGRNYYTRFLVAGVWGAWQLIEPTLATRLGSTAATVTDANSANESGFYKIAAASSNMPVAEDGTIITVKYSSTVMTQIFESSSANKMYMRRMTGGAWQAWVAVYPANVTDATGTLPRANVGITTISQAEAEAGTATTDRIFTAERVAQAITNLIGGALRTLRALSLSAGDLLYATGAGVLTRLAKGTAGQVLKMNSGATAPEWGAVEGVWEVAAGFPWTPSADEETHDFTGLSVYKDIRIVYALTIGISSASGLGMLVQARASGGSWLNLLDSSLSGSSTLIGVYGEIEVLNFGDSTQFKHVAARQAIGGQIDASSGGGSATTTDGVLGYFSHALAFDEIRFDPKDASGSANAYIEGTTADQRGRVVVYGRR